MRAWNLTREAAHYRHQAFSAGLRAAGYDVQQGQPRDVKPGDLVLTWNRYGEYHNICTAVEKVGGIAIIAENGYLAPGGQSPHSQRDRQWYALGRGAHNDDRAIPEGDGSRWRVLGVDLKPQRTDGRHILVCPNRSFGAPGRIQPVNFAVETVKHLSRLTKREIRLRPHPGNEPPKRPLAEDLWDCWAVVIWHSSAGVHALIHGIPVICCAPAWICKRAADAHLECVEKINDRGGLESRAVALQRLAWGQWHLTEIQDGTAFDHLLRPARKSEITAST